MFLFLGLLFLVISCISGQYTHNTTFYFTNKTLPSLSKFKYSTALTKTSHSGNLTIAWTVEGRGTAQESLYFALFLTDVPNLTYAWMGLGFGREMRGTEMLIAHYYPGQGVQVHEHRSTYKYETPLQNEGNEVHSIFAGGYVDNVFFVEGSRQARPSENSHTVLNTNGWQNFIWAYNSDSPKGKGNWFAYHGENAGPEAPFSQNHGAISLDLASGDSLVLTTAPFGQKQIHGTGMIVTFLAVFPLGAFFARFLKSVPSWFYLHTITQVLGVVGVITFFVIITLSSQKWFLAHAVLGVILIGLVAFQLSFGSFTCLGMIRDDVLTFRWLRWAHRITAGAILLLAIPQVYLGLENIYPWSENRGREVWAAYMFLCCFWFLVFSTSQLYVYLKGSNFNKVKHGEKDPLFKKGPQIDALLNSQKAEDLSLFTWNDIKKQVEDGKILVIANSQYVYDASKWITSHPGGKVILYNVAGTDITLDYFAEAGYDAAQFLPRKAIPEKSKESRQAPVFSPNESLNVASPRYSLNSNISMTAFYSFDEQDWNFVQKSRRTHIHTRMAIERLSSLLVGEIVNSKGSSATVLGNLQFSPDEYRRYALTKSQELTSDKNSYAKYYLYRFCALYPYQDKEGQPLKFKFGDCVEISVRLPNGTFCSRYYTPISGNLTCFEIIVKETPNGVMTQWLSKQRPGDKQIKIRGPFGTSPLLYTVPANGHPALPIVPSNFLYVAAGSGITPFIQFANQIFLNLNEPLQVAYQWVPTSVDELSVSPGEFVSVLRPDYDGWAYGVNLNTGAEGVFPMGVAVPGSGFNFKVTLVNVVRKYEDLICQSIIDGCVLAYPQQIQVHYIIEETVLSEVHDKALIYQGTLETHLERIISTIDPNYERKACICGPPKFNNVAFDLLTDRLFWDTKSISVFASDTYK